MPHLPNDPDTQIDKTILKLAEQYAGCDRRSAEINEERATIRKNIDKLGIVPRAFVHAVAQIKQMSNGERRDYQTSVQRVLGVIGDRQGELYPEETKRNEKREAERKPSGKEGAPDPDKNPRSDPKSGGAGKKPVEAARQSAAKSDAAVKDAIAKVIVATGPGSAPGAMRSADDDAAEQAEGAAALAQAPTNETAAKPLSQSAQAQAALNKAGI